MKDYDNFDSNENSNNEFYEISEDNKLNSFHYKFNQMIKSVNTNFFSNLKVKTLENSYGQDKILCDYDSLTSRKESLANEIGIINKIITSNEFNLNLKISIDSQRDCNFEDTKTNHFDKLILNTNNSLENENFEKLIKYAKPQRSNFLNNQYENEENDNIGVINNNKILGALNLNKVGYEYNDTSNKKFIKKIEEEEEMNFINNNKSKKFSLLEINSKIRDLGKNNFSPINQKNRNNFKSINIKDFNNQAFNLNLSPKMVNNETLKYSNEYKKQFQSILIIINQFF